MALKITRTDERLTLFFIHTSLRVILNGNASALLFKIVSRSFMNSKVLDTIPQKAGSLELTSVCQLIYTRIFTSLRVILNGNAAALLFKIVSRSFMNSKVLDTIPQKSGITRTDERLTLFLINKLLRVI